jgi:hypothetical protein
MSPIMFYLVAVALFGLGALLIRNTDPHESSGGDRYAARMRRRLAGKISMVAATLSLGLGIMTQFYSSNALAIPPLPTSAGQLLTPIDLAPQPASQTPGNTPALNFTPISSSPGQSQITSIAPAPRQTSQLLGNMPELNSPPASGIHGQLPAVPAAFSLPEVVHLMEQNQYDAALDQVNAALRAAPKNPDAYALRGDIYAAKKLWDRAERDYQTVLQIDGTSVQIKFNLAQIEFAQKKYDAARARFAALQHNPDMGDLAAYKVFLCDLLGGHEDIAARELDAFNRVGSNASYYFANAAWSLDHQKRDDAREWLIRAGYIYAPYKFKLYADNLSGLGNRGTSGAPSPASQNTSTNPAP